MRGKASPIGLLTLVAALVVLAFAASPAKAEFGLAEWEAVTCEENSDTPAEIGPPPAAVTGTYPLPEDPEQCNKDTDAKWYTHAAGHPKYGITDFTLNTFEAVGAKGFPEGFIREIVVDTPEGLGVNPESTLEKCTVEQLEQDPPTCPATSLVGFNYLTVAGQAPPCAAPFPGECLNVRAKTPVFNLVPFDGVPSMVGFPTSAPGEPTFIVGDLDPKDQHVRFTISDIHAPDGSPEHPPIIGSRLVFNGRSVIPGVGDETYLTMPSNCAGGQTSTIRVKSWEGAEDTASFTTDVGADKCDEVPFNPGLGIEAGGSVDSPEPATVDVQMPDQLKPKVEVANSHLLVADVRLPEGAGINPSLANGLAVCTDAQFKKGTDDPIECPAASRIGSVDVVTAALDQPLGGDVYVAQPLSQDPTSGNQFRIFIHAFNERYGVNVRLVGNVYPNLQTGQVRAIVPDNPQAPFNSFKVTLDGGPRGAITSPPICGPHTVTAAYTPWSRPNEQENESAQFAMATRPSGAPCPPTLATRPWDPGYAAGTRSSKAGAYSPIDVRVTRKDGEQELKEVDVKLPPGMVAKLRGVDYCPEASIAAARNASGNSTKANAPCPSSSFVGTTKITAGSGPAPYLADGDVYLAGPYKGAPVSLVFVTPAVAGPYDLGTVVVRAALNLNPETAEVHAVSDPIPHVFGGVKLDIRTIDIAITRSNFSVNPTTCRQTFPVAGFLWGGSSNPDDKDAWALSAKNGHFQGTDCKALKFKPKFWAKIFGGKNQMRRNKNPKFRAILKARNGDANIRRATFILPKGTILDQGHIGTICTRVRLAANDCPKGSIYGHAKATSPLIDGKLKGRVYLVASDNLLPDLLADLKGQVNVRLRGVISAQRGRLKTVFQSVPDVAVNKFILTMKGGKKGLLVNSQNLCAKKKRTAYLKLVAQNQRRVKKKKLRVNIPGCRSKGKKKRNR